MLGAILSSICRLTVPPYVFDMAGFDGQTYTDFDVIDGGDAPAIALTPQPDGNCYVTHVRQTGSDTAFAFVSGADPSDPLLQIMFHRVTGSAAAITGGGSFDVWVSLAMGTGVSLSIGPGTALEQIQVSFRYAGGPPLATATFTLGVSFEP